MGDEKRKAGWKPRRIPSSVDFRNGKFGAWIHSNSTIKEDKKRITSEEL